MRCCLLVLLLLLAFAPRSAAAHIGEPLAPHDLWTAWEFPPALVILALALVYLHAVTTLWRVTGADGTAGQFAHQTGSTLWQPAQERG